MISGGGSGSGGLAGSGGGTTTGAGRGGATNGRVGFSGFGGGSSGIGRRLNWADSKGGLVKSIGVPGCSLAGRNTRKYQPALSKHSIPIIMATRVSQRMIHRRGMHILPAVVLVYLRLWLSGFLAAALDSLQSLYFCQSRPINRTEVLAMAIDE